MVKCSADKNDRDVRRCTPIFVVGHYRSGTTWVANLLEAHPSIYTPTHPEHHGQVESAFFSSFLPYCSWGRTEQDRLAMRAIFECSDYWHLLFPDDPPDVNASTQTPASYFRECMDLATQRRGCSHWVEKTPPHTLLMGYLLKTFPDAFFVAVERNIQDVVRSYMFNSKDPHSLWGWVTRAVSVEIFRKVICRYGSSVIKIRYEDLRTQPEMTMRNLYDKLGLENPDANESKWPANSSFSHSPARTPIHFRVVVTFVSWAFKLIPGVWCERIGLRYLGDLNERVLPGWLFRVFKGRYGGFRG